jgi:mannose-1-phosphate guanylyltransferase/mannose-6-phosphate isomerase
LTLHPVILCGGHGTRLWPSSTKERPKPFLDLLDGPSLFQRTASRLAAIPGACDPLVVTGMAHLDEARRQLDEIGIRGRFLIEPESRDSAPAVIAAAVDVARRDPEGVIVCVASDHHIVDVKAFVDGVRLAAAAARAGSIVTFGVKPRFASTAFGYIRPGAPLPGAPDVLRVDTFEEKPDLGRAESLLREGCLWNSGNFVFTSRTMLAEAEPHCADLIRAAAAALEQAEVHDDVVLMGPAFHSARRVSIDVAVMERTAKAAVLPIDYDWSDLGSWNAVWTASVRDESGNAVRGAVTVMGSERCLVRAEPGVNVVALGLRDIAVVADAGNVLVCDLARAPEVRPPATDNPSARTEAGRSVGLADAAHRMKAWFWEAALPLWWCFGADHEGGGFHESLRWDLSTSGRDRRLRVQARQVFVYATAGAMAWPGPWASAVRHGLAFMDSRFRRPDGLYRALVSPAGYPVDDSAELYDQAFALLALAAASKSAPDLGAESRRRASDLCEGVLREFATPGGGFSAREGADLFLSDPIMHLLEAALAWSEIDPSPIWRNLADAIAVHALDRMLDGAGRMREAFDASWRPAAGPEGDLIEPGHQFEWSWLLERWARSACDDRAHRAAVVLYQAGLRGVHPASGVVCDEAVDGSWPASLPARLWPQTERLKATLLLEADPARRADHALSAIAAIERYLTAEPRGLWRDSPHAQPITPEGVALASSFYHLAAAIEALSREIGL